MINIGAALLWGFFATLVLSTIVRAARDYGISRMDIPLMVLFDLFHKKFALCANFS